MSHTVRILVVAVAVGSAGPAAAQSAQPAAQSGEPAARSAAARMKPIKVNVAAELTALVGTDVEAARVAADRLGRSRQPAAYDGLLDALALGLEPSVARAALEGLGRHAKASSFDVLAHYTHYRNPEVRVAAVTALGTLDDRRAEQRVLALLVDPHRDVRAAAATVIASRKLVAGVEPLLELLKKGDEPAAAALAALATPELARTVGELIGVAPDDLLARCLGGILLRKDFSPEPARVEVVRALGKIPSNEALEQLTTYVASVPEKPPRQSRREAEALVEQRLSGGR